MERFKLLTAVHLFLIRDGKILLLRRANTGYEDGNYSVPAGHIDGDESITIAMAREALEEAKIIFDSKKLTVVHVMHRKADDGERMDFFLTASEWSGDPVIGEPNKCDDLSWFDLTMLPENVIPYVQSALNCYTDGKFFSEFGW